MIVIGSDAHARIFEVTPGDAGLNRQSQLVAAAKLPQLDGCVGEVVGYSGSSVDLAFSPSQMENVMSMIESARAQHPIRFRRARSDGTLRSVQAEIEKKFGFRPVLCS